MNAASSLQSMDTAPRDGSAFLVRNLPYGDLHLCMRRIVIDINSAGQTFIRDLGGWAIVHGIDDDFDRLPTTGEPSWAVAPDDLNDISKWGWMPLPRAKDFPS